jgi:hypothetical protein
MSLLGRKLWKKLLIFLLRKLDTWVSKKFSSENVTTRLFRKRAPYEEMANAETSLLVNYPWKTKMFFHFNKQE